MSLYDRASATAMRLLTKFGRPWTFTTTAQDSTTTTRSAVGVYVDTVKHLLGDSGVQIGDKRFVFANSANPLLSDNFTNGSESYAVMQVEPIGDTPAAFWVWGRKA